MFGLIEKLRDSRNFGLLFVISLFLIGCYFLSFVSIPVHEFGHHITCSAMGRETEWISYNKVNCVPHPEGLSNKVLLASGGVFSAIIFLILMESFYWLGELNEENKQTAYIMILFLPVIFFQVFNIVIETFVSQQYHLINGNVFVSGSIFLYFFIVVLWNNKDILDEIRS